MDNNVIPDSASNVPPGMDENYIEFVEAVRHANVFATGFHGAICRAWSELVLCGADRALCLQRHYERQLPMRTKNAW